MEYNKIYIKGAYFVEKESQYGNYLTASIDIEAFKLVIEQYAKLSKNGKKYLNFNIYKSKTPQEFSTHSAVVSVPKEPQAVAKPKETPETPNFDNEIIEDTL